jgi:hypothetical protein
MPRQIAISDEVSLPESAVTQTFGCIGRRGAGKTYLAGVLCEQMLDLRAQVIVLDAVGNWYGLRVGADGKSKGKDIFVIGGQHGDVPLTSDAGATIARFLVEKSVSAVLDISALRQGERKRFASDFGEEFFHLKKAQRSAVHLFIEEAQLFIPQRYGADQARMLGAFENIVRLGRNYGIGATLISQRPQSVNKEVLSQVECLCVLQVNGTQERKALEDWVQEAGADRKLVGNLPGLGRGEGYVWSPSWLRIFKRVHFAKKTTFDASATPEVGRAMKAAMVSAVDVEALKAALSSIVEKAQEDDPKALRSKIHELTVELAAARSGKANPSPALRTELEKTKAERDQALAAADEAMRLMEGSNVSVMSALKLLAQLRGSNQSDIKPKSPPAKMIRPFDHESSSANIKTVADSIKTATSSNGHGQAEESKDPQEAAQRKLIGALRAAESSGISSLSRTWLAIVARVSPTSSSYRRNVSALEQAGLVHFPTPGDVALTDSTIEANAGYIGSPMPRVTTASLLDGLQKIYEPARYRILLALVEASGEWMGREELAAAAAQSPTSSAYRSHLSNLRQLGLVDIGANSTVRIDPFIFLREAVTA